MHVSLKNIQEILRTIKRFSIILALNSVLALYKMFIRPRLDYEDILYGKPNNEMFC